MTKMTALTGKMYIFNMRAGFAERMNPCLIIEPIDPLFVNGYLTLNSTTYTFNQSFLIAFQRSKHSIALERF